ncbi:proton-coupled folate transporter isoform X2 [Strongylocentrotus purpuratus]|nr:proton-coupled folate transporter isoform X2 [Strongylocentrotus purpuratus]XP_030831542.1 proton-coupled folate transporter isoform X2 [Strongylocentrotus purpuratus]XP_030831543.1 proton-coupled folate transporter isoform X2 [Strongylocentrotus purpuratus]XP_030831544.1 proton-coupled folate transporter isoform X2 [Strongylocentrotus purpuratus]XP_030831545.1 proton-coupled folate transporter isoform X2 [Strongylocentrotus purpuratus]|eukprot:XP_003725814.1 PREDICTED: proton-coupled folate transporter isoform X2 [Strongylocentrotus purpuratus]
MDNVEEISKARYIATEPINFLLFGIQGMLTTLRTLYIQETLASDYEYNLLPQQDGNCSLPNVSNPLEVQINSETALWVMWLASISTFLPILTASVLVASSDFIGRKPILIFSATGHLIASLIYLLVAVARLPLAVTFLAAITLGICGDTSAAFTVCTAYIADSTSGNTRTQRLVLQSLVLYAGWGSGQAVVGVLLRYLGNFPVCFAVPVALSVINLAYTICPGVLLETISPREHFNAKKVLRKSFKNLRGIFRRRMSGGRWRLWCLITIVCPISLVNESIYDVIVIYGLGSPFCWTADVVGYYSAAVSLFPAGVAALIVKPLLRCFSEYWLIHFSIISFLAQIVTSALAQNTVQLAIIATVVSFMRTTASPVCKDLISRAVTKREHGMYFALLSLATSIVAVCSPFLINGLFAYTNKIGFPQITFYVTSVILLFPMTLNGILQNYVQKTQREKESSKLDDQTDGSRNQSLRLEPSDDEI